VASRSATHTENVIEHSGSLILARTLLNELLRVAVPLVVDDLRPPKKDDMDLLSNLGKQNWI
jgi:hypothetical protein